MAKLLGCGWSPFWNNALIDLYGIEYVALITKCIILAAAVVAELIMSC